jgi:hypothetical protein
LGRLEVWDPGADDWRLLGRFETSADRPSAAATFGHTEATRVRAVVERIDPANRSATIHSWRWHNSRQKKPK